MEILKKTGNFNKLPPTFVWITLFITISPFLLNLLGFDFANEHISYVEPLSGQIITDKHFHLLAGAFTHTILEWSAFMLALLACALSFSNYAVEKDPVTPVLGIALLCAGVMDAFHALTVDRLIQTMASNKDFIPFTWALCRLFNSLICLVGIGVVFFRKEKPNQKNSILILFVGIIFVALSYFIISYCVESSLFPRTQFPDALITRPWDLYPFFIFLITSFVYYKYYKRNPSPFAHALLLSVIPDLATQMHMALGSSQLFDNHFNIAHFLKIISYAVPYSGLAWSYISTNREKDSSNRELTELTTALNSSALISETDHRGKIVYANEKFVQASQYSEKELFGKSHNIINSGFHQKEYFKKMWETISSGRNWKGEIKNKSKDGNYYWVDSTIYPKFDSSGKIKGYVSIRYDITNKKKHEESLKKTYGEVKILNKLLFIDNSLRVELDKKMSTVLKLLFSIPWLCEKRKGGLFIEDGDTFRTLIQENLDKNAELIFNKGEDEDRYEIPVVENGRIIGIGVFFINDGHRKNDDEQRFLESCHEIIFNLIGLHIQQEELVKSRDEARVAEKAKTEFLANMSHEIRTPMNGVLGMVQLLKGTKLNKEQVDMLETIHSCGDGLLAILNDVLDVSKFESGKLNLEIIKFDLVKCIEEALYLCSLNASEKGVELRFFPPVNGKKWFMGDLTRVRQILVNLLSNAVKFTDKGYVQVSYKIVEEDDQSSKLNICVKDTGVGIPQETQRRLFESFVQADNSTTRKYGGTGLGLSICMMLAKLMEGDIKIESEEGKGATFIVELKLGSVKEKSNLIQVKDINKERKLTENFFDTNPHKILVVEDNSVNQKLVKMMLKKIGYECDVAGNGIEALEALRVIKNSGGFYTLIFMDMQMPEMDGLEATKKIIELYGPLRPMIVAMTANAFSEDKERCFEAGMDDFISKPINKSELLRALSLSKKKVG